MSLDSKPPISLPVVPKWMPTHDNTMLSAFNTCPRLYYLLYMQHKRPSGATPALDFGSIMHLMISQWYDAQVNQHLTANEALKAALEVGMRAKYSEKAGDYRTRERALLMMAEYAGYYGYGEPRRRWKIIFAETAFDIMLDGFPYGGKIDLLVEDQDSGKLYVVDHKTTSRFGEDYYDQYVPDTQTAGYVVSGGVLHGKPIAGVIMNVLVVHKNKKPPEQQFNWRKFDYPEFYAEEWKTQTVMTLSEIAEARKHGYFRPRWQSCVGKYGKCSAYYLCRSLPENRQKVVDQTWRDDEWDWRSVDEVPDGPAQDEGPTLLPG